MMTGTFRGFGLSVDFNSYRWSWIFDAPMSMEFHVAICVLYALSVFAMQQLVKSFGDNWKPPTWMNTVKLTHNIALSLVSGWMFVVMVKETYQAGN